MAGRRPIQTLDWCIFVFIKDRVRDKESTNEGQNGVLSKARPSVKAILEGQIDEITAISERTKFSHASTNIASQFLITHLVT